MIRRLLTGACAAACLALAAGPAGAATVSIDGPSADIPTTQQVAVAAAPDGSAALAWRRKVGGVDRVFVARLSGGAWSAPVQVDANLGPTFAAGAPAVGVADGGKVVVLFPSGPNPKKFVYSAIAPAAGQPFGPAQVAADEQYWFLGVKLALAPNGDGYAIARTEPAGNPDLYALRLQGTTWTAVGGPFPAGVLDATPANAVFEDDVHGADVAVARDGAAATVIFTETLNAGQYQLFARRIAGDAIGPAVPATVSTDTLAGAPISDSASDMADVAMDGAGMAWVAFRQAFTYGLQQRFRGIARPFDGTAFGSIQVTDGLGAAPAENVEYHALAVNAAGAGLVTTYRGLTNDAEGSALGAGTWLTPAFPLNPAPSDQPSRGSAALSDTGAGLFAFRHRPTGGSPVVLGRVRALGALAAPEQLSTDAFGDPGPPVHAAAADLFAVTSFLQGTAATTRIVAATVPLPQPPATPGPTPPAPAPGGADVTAPRITALGIRPAAFRAGPGRLGRTGRGRARVTLTLAEPATVRFTAERRVAGRRAGGRCVAPTRRAGARCLRSVPSGGAVRLSLPAGTSRLAFSGRLARALRPGRHRLVATPTDTAGNRGAARRATFTVLAPRRR
jgi:hypothetical protein